MYRLFLFHILFSLYLVPSSSRCNETFRNPPEFIDRHSSYSLWPGLISPHSLKYGQSLLGMEPALRKVWYHQHPSDCTRVKYLISEGWFQEFGLELHGHGVALGLALDTNRVFLQEDGWTWRYRNEHCKNQNLENWECYFEPFSKCTLKDAIVSHLKAQKVYGNSHQNHAHSNGGATGTHGRPGGAYSGNEATAAATGAAGSTSASAVGAHASVGGHGPGTDSVTWSAQEDILLRGAVIKYGRKGKWADIGHEVGTKTDAQCHSRWFTHLQSIVENDSKLTKEERKSMTRDDPNIHDYRTKFHGVLSLNRVTDAKIVDGKVVFDVKYPELSDQILVISNNVILKSRTFVPSDLVNSILRKCSDPAYYYYWWRSISMTYLIRPNLRTLDFIDSHRDSTLRESQGKCISTFIRHTKSAPAEKQTLSFQAYANAALQLFDNPEVFPLTEYPSAMYSQYDVAGDTSTTLTTKTASATATTATTSLKAPQKRIFYFASEDHDNFAEAEAWGKKHKIVVRYSNLSTVLLHPDHYHQPDEFEETLPQNHELEYFSYILHLHEILSCDVVICPMSSHYCRIIDELRMTVSGNSNGWNADISLQTCEKPPCIRRFGLANHEDGAVYDPQGIIW